MTTCTWSPGSAARAAAQVLEALLSGRVARQAPSESSEVLVCSYAEDFDHLWRLGDPLLEWLASGERHVVLIQHGVPRNKRLDANSPDEFLPADAWAAALTLAIYERTPALVSACRITVLDFAPRRSLERPAGSESSLAEASMEVHSLLPHVSTMSPWALRAFFNDLRSPTPAEMPALDARKQLGQLWRLLYPDKHAGRTPQDGTLLDSLRRAPLGAYAKAVNQENARYRHDEGFGAFRVAVRLLLGAMQAGTVSPEDGRDLLRRIRERQPAAPLEDEYDFDLLRRYMELLQRLEELPKYSPPSSGDAIQAQRKLLLIDDDYERAGWDIVLPALFPEWQVEVGPPSIFDERLRAGSGFDDYQLILLDYHLGDNAKRNGLDLLDEVRAVHPFLPTVLFTGEDDTALLSRAIDQGASAYFVKELADTEDRDSARYFTALRDMVEHFKAIDPEGTRRLWTVWRQVDSLARRIRWEKTLLSNEEALAAQAVTSFERALLWWAYALQSVSDDRREAHRAIGIALTQCIEALDMLMEVKGDKAGEVTGPRNFAKASRHGESLADITNSVIDEYCSTTLLYLRGVLPDVGRADVALVSVPVQAAQGSGGTPAFRIGLGTHEQRSVYGAVRFVLGYYVSRGVDPDEVGCFGIDFSAPKSQTSVQGHDAVLKAIKEFSTGVQSPVDQRVAEPLEVLLIDDTAREDGWLLALRTGLPDMVVRHLPYKGHEEDERACGIAASSDIVLLDLRLPAALGQRPDEGVGLQLLGSIRQRVPDVPIIVLSANEDVLSTRRCLKAGAVAYFPKTWKPLPQGEACEYRAFYEEYYHALRSHLQTQGPSARVLPFSSVCARLGRPQRYRAFGGLHLAEWIQRLSDFVLTLAWVQRDAHLRWLHGRLVHSPAAWGAQEATLTEATVCLTAVVEHLMRSICAQDRRTQGEDVTKATLGDLIGIARKVIDDKILLEKLRQLNKIRNRILHVTDAESEQIVRKSESVDLGEVLSLATTALPPLTRRLIEENLPSEGMGSAAALRRELEYNYGQGGPRSVRDTSSAYILLVEELARRWEDAERSQRTAVEAEREGTARCEAMRVRRTGLEAQKDQKMAAAAVDRRAAKAVEEAYGPMIKKAEAELEAAEFEVSERARVADAAARRADEAWCAHWEHLETIPPVPSVSARRRWAVARDWIEERSIEERTASVRGETPGPCHWDREPLSSDLDRIVRACVAAGCNEAGIWARVRSWIDGAPLPDLT